MLEVRSSAIKNKGFIPAKYTCDGEDINPPLVISGLPENTKSVALIMDDPDATGGIIFDHWIVWNISPEGGEVELNENGLPVNALQGATGFGKNQYGGPCPPRGNPAHRYVFKVYALDAVLSLPEGSSKEELEKSMEGHILEQNELVGLYGR